MLSVVLLGLIGGLITGISPCVLPVLPVVFLAGGLTRPPETGAASAQPVGKRALATVGGPGTDADEPSTPVPTTTRPSRAGATPYLVILGLVVSFSVVTLVGTVLLQALHLPQSLLRWAGLVVLVALGIGMIVPWFGDLLERPFTWIPQRAVGPKRGRGGAFVMGLALGAVYVPCAGPILAAIVVSGATGHIGGRTIALTAAFAIGAAIPLLIFALAGKRVAERVRVFRNHQRNVRRWAGVVVIALAVALAFNVTDVIQRWIPDYTASLNADLNKAGATSVPQAVGAVANNDAIAQCAQDLRAQLLGCGPAPDFTDIQQWFNTPGDAPLTMAGLRGKVVLVDFWAYSCINCQRAIPHVQAWYQAYANDGLVVVGVHTPEYAFEHEAGNVRSGAQRLGITYPVAIDNDYGTWNAYANQSWPADYLIDSTGQIRHVGIGEGQYGTTEELIRQLLTAATPGVTLPNSTNVADRTPTEQTTPETYLGSQRAELYVNPDDLHNGTATYSFPQRLPADTFALDGTWTMSDQSITAGKSARIELNFTAKQVYLDVSGTGTLTVTDGGRTSTIPVSGAPNIYTVVDQAKATSGTLTVGLSAGLSAYSFTYG
jgi:cytochrome c biogenesis protein CcdA/thiol-disulfide isomerase/thioredoxin